MLTMQKKFLSFIFILASVTAAPVYAMPFFKSSVKARHEKMLADEERAIVKKITYKNRLLTLSYNAANKYSYWKDYIIETIKKPFCYLYPALLAPEETNNMSPIDPHIEEIVKKLLVEHNLTDVHIIPFGTTCTNRSVTGEIFIGISTQELKGACQNDREIEAVILHEIMHIKNKDFAYVFERNSELNHFCEKRADLQAGLVSLEHAKASRDCFKRLSREESWDHPSDKTRAEYMQQLVQDLEEEQRAQHNTGVATC